MPLEWGSQAGSAGTVEWGTQLNEAFVAAITTITGTIANGETITISTVLLGTITSATYGGFALTIDSTDTDEATLTLPALLDLDWGAEHDLVVGDGTDTATRAEVLNAPAGEGFVDLVSVPDFGETDSLAELGENTTAFIGYTAAIGQQIQFTTHANMTVADDSTLSIDPAVNVVGIFRIRYDDGGTPRYIEHALNIGEPDLVPNAFSFNDLTDQIPSTQVTSNTIVPDGYNETLPISVTNAMYSINGGAFTADAGTIDPTDSVALQLDTAAGTPANVVATLDIGGVTTDWTVANLSSPPDSIPTQFSFADAQNVALNAESVSNAITVAGINIPAGISVTGGEYRIDGGSWTSDAGIVIAGQQVEARGNAPAGYGQTQDVVLTIGTVSDTYTIATPAVDTTPTAFTFNAVTGVDRSSEQTSNTITITGINTDAAISIDGGEYSIDGAPYTAIAGTVSNNQFVTVRLNAASEYLTQVSATLTVDAVTAVFTVTTREQPALPTLVLAGDDTVTVLQGSDYIEAGYLAYDDEAGDITDTVQVTGTVDTETPATYILTYRADHTSSGGYVELTRSVIVRTTAKVLATIPDQSFTEGDAISIDASGVFTDFINLTIDVSPEEQALSINNAGIITGTAVKGVHRAVASAHASHNSVQSNVVTLSVAEAAATVIAGEPLDANVAIEPAATDGMHGTIYDDNTNAIVITRVIGQISGAGVTTPTITGSLRTSTNTLIQTLTFQTYDQGWFAAVPDDDYSDAVLHITISSGGSTGDWEIPVTWTSRQL